MKDSQLGGEMTELNPEEQEHRYVMGWWKGAVKVEKWCFFKGFQLGPLSWVHVRTLKQVGMWRTVSVQG